MYCDAFHPYPNAEVTAFTYVSNENEKACPSLRGSLVFALSSSVLQFVRHCSYTDDYYPIVSLVIDKSVGAMASSDLSEFIVCHIVENNQIAVIDLTDGKDVRFRFLPLSARFLQVHDDIFLSDSEGEFAMASEFSSGKRKHTCWNDDLVLRALFQTYSPSPARPLTRRHDRGSAALPTASDRAAQPSADNQQHGVGATLLFQGDGRPTRGH